MDAQFLVRPVERGGEADPVRVFHLAEGIFNVRLRATADDDVLGRPLVLVGAEDAFPEACPLEAVESGEVRGEGEVEFVLGSGNGRLEELGNILARGNGFELLFQGLPGVAFAARRGVLAAVQFRPQLCEGRAFFAQGRRNARQLPRQQFFATRDDDRAFFAPHDFFRVKGGGAFEPGYGERLELTERNRQEVRVVGQRQGGNEMIRAGIEVGDRGGGRIAAIEDQRNILAVLGHQVIARDQSLHHTRKHRGIILIARVEMGEQGNVKVCAHQQGQADDPQVFAFALGVPALGEGCGRGRGNKRVKIGGIEQERLEVDLELLHQAGGQLLFNRGQRVLLAIRHLVPKPLTPQQALGNGQQACQHARAIPVIERRLAAGRHTAVEGGQ